MGFSRQEYWSGLLFPFPGDLPNTGIKPMSLAWAGWFFTTEPPGNPYPLYVYLYVYIIQCKLYMCVCLCMYVCIFSNTAGNPHVGDESSKSICFQEHKIFSRVEPIKNCWTRGCPHVYIDHGDFSNVAICLLKCVSQGNRERVLARVIILLNLITGVILHHLCHILLLIVKSESFGLTYIQRGRNKYQTVINGDILEVYQEGFSWVCIHG